MYSVRPHSSEAIVFDLPTTMYSIQPIIQPIEQAKSSSLSLKDIEERQYALLDKLENLHNQLVLYQNIQKQVSNEKAACLSRIPVREELVVHLAAKQPSKDILNLIEKFHDKLSIRTYRHSSLRDKSFVSPVANSTSSNTQNKTRSLAIIWADDSQLPYMFYSKMKINDEQSIVNLINHELTNKD